MLTQTKLPDPTDTIVALSSAAGIGARAIGCLSGGRAVAVAGALCPDLRTEPAHLFSGGLRLAGVPAAIPADVYHFVAPRTYTGQDVIEIHTVSCRPIVEAVIAECL